MTAAGSKRSVTIFAAFGAFVAANVIHNNFGLDPAVVPAAVLLALYWWRPARGLLWATAFVIAFPAFSFLQWPALLETTNVARLANHVALLLAGVLAVLGAILGLLRTNKQTSPGPV